jgi:hypothetical protein
MSSSTSAQIFNFDNLKHNPNFNGFLPSNGGFLCTGGDKCSSNIDGGLFGGELDYVSGIFSVAATGYFQTAPGDPYNQFSVVQDHEDGYNGPRYDAGAVGAGLGVYHELNNTTDDNVTLGEMIKLSFNMAVRLDWIGLRAEGHNTTNWVANATYQYSTDATNWTTANLPTNTGKFDFNPDLVSKDYYFRFGGTTPDQFYISAAAVTAAPEPASVALMGLGLGVVGLIARRRRNH